MAGIDSTLDRPARDVTLHGLVMATAANVPDAVAIQLDGGGRLTYGELGERACRLAARLRAEGVGPGSLVGICLDRSLDLAVGLLGVLLSGAAYVPLDPAYPMKRLELMLEDSGSVLVLAHAETLSALPASAPRVLRLDVRDETGVEDLSADLPEAASQDIAYVIYTSGSTGRPKGVMIPHRALCNFMSSMRETPGFSAQDTLVSVTTPCFDIFGLELFLPLVTGGRVVIASRRTTGDGIALAALLESCDATVMQATPATWRLLIDAGWSGRRELRALCGGEALPPVLAGELLERCGEVWNMFGPTETTIWSTCIRLKSAEPPIPIGRAIANTELYILDEDGAILAPGAEGELCIGGDGLARGYFERPELTAERFIDHPGLGRRLYRTGDLARMRPDGILDYLGRLDNQVKIRGFRIELGEIEVALERLSSVAQAVVSAHPASTGEPELVAYVVTSDGGPPDASGLRRALHDVLPDYMVPPRVMGLDAMPLTPNGKVDRKSLPEPSYQPRDTVAVEPRTPLEKRLVAIWEDTLDIHPVGVTDDFFELGVSSLTAARLFAAIEHEIGNELPLGAIFQAPTVEALARLLEGGEMPRWTSLVPIQTGGSRPPIHCLHGGAGTILFAQRLAHAFGPDQPFYGLQARGLYGKVAPLATVEEMAAHYLAEIRTVQRQGPYYLAGYCFGAIVAFEMAQTLTRGGEEVAMLAALSGPSASWTRTWGWHGAQPSVRPRIEARRAARGWVALDRSPKARIRRLPRGLVRRAARQMRRAHVHLNLALGRPIPEEARERFFLALHGRAERAYHEEMYPGEILSIYGEGLYEDPALGWAPFARDGVVTHAVPGVHLENRDLVMEPHIFAVRDRIQEYLETRAHAARQGATLG